MLARRVSLQKSWNQTFLNAPLLKGREMNTFKEVADMYACKTAGKRIITAIGAEIF